VPRDPDVMGNFKRYALTHELAWSTLLGMRTVSDGGMPFTLSLSLSACENREHSIPNDPIPYRSTEEVYPALSIFIVVFCK